MLDDVASEVYDLYSLFLAHHKTSKGLYFLNVQFQVPTKKNCSLIYLFFNSVTKKMHTLIIVGNEELSCCLPIKGESSIVIIVLGLDGGVGSGVFSPSAFINLLPVVGQSVNGLFGLLGGIETSEMINKIYILTVSVMTNF